MKQNILQDMKGNTDTKRMMNLYGLITGQTATGKRLENYIQEQFDNSSNENTSARSTGIQGINGDALSFATLGQKSGDAVALAGLVQNLGEQVSRSMSDIKQAVDECFDSVRKIYPELVDLAIESAKDAQIGKTEEEFLKEVLKKKNKTLIKIKEADQLSMEQVSIVKTLARLEMLINAIPIANNGTS